MKNLILLCTSVFVFDETLIHQTSAFVILKDLTESYVLTTIINN